jgi:hypothetical protein
MHSRSKDHELKYYLLSPTNPPIEFAELHNQAFHSWLKITREAFSEVGNGDDGHLHEDFIRQHVVSCLCAGNEVVATFLHAFASIYTDATRSFRYMRDNFPEMFFEKIKKMGIRNVMTSNYLAVHPEWRRGKHDLQIAPIMVGLSLRVRDLYGADGFIGVWRNDRKVNELSYAQGGECIVKNVYNHKTPCDLILMKSEGPYKYPSPEVEKAVSSLWENRTEAFFKPELAQIRKAA